MELIIGGAFQGKREAAQRMFGIAPEELADGRVCSQEELYACKGVHHFHEYIRRVLEQQGNAEGLADELQEKNPGIVVISDEIGYGIVPLDASERLWREQTGRVCCRLAAASSHVVRVVAGIGTVLKGGAL